jgi:glycerol-3-phosphate O-acyltransferase
MLKDTEQKGTVVYVLRGKSYLNYLIYNWLFLSNDLPRSKFAQGLYWLPWQPLGQQLRVFAMWLGRLIGLGGKGADEVFRGLVRHGETTMIFLKRPVTLYTYFRRAMYWYQNQIHKLLGWAPVAGGRQHDLIEELVKLQRQQDTPIFLCPQVMVWDPVPASTRKTFWDVVFGEKEFPGVLREIYLFWRNRSKSRVRGGEPINLREVIESSPRKLTDADIARKVRWNMLDRFEKETRVVAGPKMRPAADMKDRVLGTNRIKAAIRAEAKEKGISEEAVRHRAYKILERMAADFSLPVARKMDWMLSQFWRRMYQISDSDQPGLPGMSVDDAGMLRLREVSKEAPLLLLPSHKSHMDYLTLSQVCLHYEVIPPHIAAGDNLSIPVVGYLFRKCGAFFIRRTFKGDNLYKEIVVEYLHRLLREGYNVEFFIEGGRSRTGKLREPKMGMLGMFVDGILDKRLRDFHLAPISINYDRIIEGESYTRELLGESKRKESLKGVLKSRSLLKANFGRVHLNFAEPISAKKWIQQHTEEQRAVDPEYDPVNNPDDRRHLIRNMAYLVVHEINSCSVIMPTALVAALLMTNPKRGLNHSVLLSQVEWLRDEIRLRGGKVASFENTDAVVEKTVHFLNKLIKQPVGLLERVYRPRDQRRLELGFYRNQIGHLFVVEGVIVGAMFSFRQMRASDAGVMRDDLFEAVRFLSRLMKLEFVFNPKHDIEVNFQDTLDGMISRQQLSIVDGRIKVTSKSDPMFSFLLALYGPFVDSYWVASLSLFALKGTEEPQEEKKLLALMQQIAETLYHEGHLRYSDTVSMESMQKALALYQDMGVIARFSAEQFAAMSGARMRRGNRSKYIDLHQAYREEISALEELLTRIGRFSSCYQSAQVVTRMRDLLSHEDKGQEKRDKGEDDA